MKKTNANLREGKTIHKTFLSVVRLVAPALEARGVHFGPFQSTGPELLSPGEILPWLRPGRDDPGRVDRQRTEKSSSTKRKNGGWLSKRRPPFGTLPALLRRVAWQKRPPAPPCM